MNLTRTDVFFLLAVVGLLVPVFAVCVRSARTCIACREQFDSAADRARHEHIAHQL